MTAIETAQAIVESTTDIRPGLKGKIVASVEGDRLSMKITFTDGDHVRFTGLYAKVINDHLPQVREDSLLLP